MKQRIKRIFESLGEGKPDAVFINYGGVKDYSFFYVTGFTGGSFEGSSAIIRRDGSCAALIPQLEENTAVKENRQNKLGLDVKVFRSGKQNIELLKKELKGCGKIGVDESAMSVATFRRLKGEIGGKYSDASAAVRDARAIKDGIEIAKIKKAVKIAEDALENIAEAGESVFRKGVGENDIAAELNFQINKMGGTNSFPSIVAFGNNAAEPHYSTGKSKLHGQEMVLVDWGVKYERYCSDLTRTFVFGRMSQKQQRMLEVVEDAQEVAFDLMREGVDAAVVHAAVKDFIERTEFRGKFVHSTGHSLGLQVHDGKTLGGDKFQLKEGMVFTVEPGVYVKGTGGVRIEDDVLIRKNGIEKLSRKNRFFEL
ncbi:MAG: Xaa-Pro peptidase family protein [Candidatus Micrarchaeota archaeon]